VISSSSTIDEVQRPFDGIESYWVNWLSKLSSEIVCPEIPQSRGVSPAGAPRRDIATSLMRSHDWYRSEPCSRSIGRSFNTTTLIPAPVDSRPVHAGQLRHGKPSRGSRLRSTPTYFAVTRNKSVSYQFS